MTTMTESEMVQSLLQDQAKLRARVGNLEVALHTMWAMLQDLQPPGAQDAIGRMMQDHFEAMKDMGAVKPGGPAFERA